MILPDLNLLIYAFNRGAAQHVVARAWWEGVMNGDRPVGLPWAVSLGFVRLMTKRPVAAQPMTPAEVIWQTCSPGDRPSAA